jgi:hypothetical protein
VRRRWCLRSARSGGDDLDGLRASLLEEWQKIWDREQEKDTGSRAEKK